MTAVFNRYARAACAVCAGLLACAALAGLGSRSPAARAASIGQLQHQISAGQGQVSSLTSAVNSASNKLGQLHASIASLEAQIARIQARLNADRADLLKLGNELSAARTRLDQLIAQEQHAESVLAQQLVSTYESNTPDLVTVVLEATGFQDLLERIGFAQRIRKENVDITRNVKAARSAVAAEATRLGQLEVRQQALTAEVLRERNSLAATQMSLLQQEIAVAAGRQQKEGQLAAARGHLSDLRHQLAQLQAAQAAERAAAAARRAAALAAAQVQNVSQGTGGGSSAPVSSSQISSGGGFTFPMPRGDASPPGTWSLDQGVDIAAPGGTPLLAVCSGTVVLHGIGGFGPSAPVLHCDNGWYIYYGHAGPGNWTPIGTHVGAGQVISEVGYGIVGISTGPHLEIGFCDSSGSPLGGGTASQMYSLLQGSY